MKEKRKRRLQNLALLLFSTAITLVIAEYAYRWMLFNGGENYKSMRDPAFFCSDSEDDYWKLYYKFGGEFKPPKNPHPFLGWVGQFDRESYLHFDAIQAHQKRPVLLYGDSFSACVEEADCFEDILNQDSTFTNQNYLLNYGVGGYGVDQAALLCSKTAPHYDRPLVVFGMLTTDMDRTLLSVRTGQKPFLDAENGKLILQGLPIDTNSAHFFEENSISFNSYLYRRFLHSDLNFLPYRISSYLTGKYAFIEEKKEVNTLLLKAVANELRQKQIDFVFLVFHFEDDMMSPKSEDNWRDQHLRAVLKENEIPYIWSKDIIRAHRLAHPENNHDAYIIPGNGHPTTLYNQLISNEIKKIAESRPQNLSKFDPEKSQIFSQLVLDQINAIKRDSIWTQNIQTKALENKIEFELQLLKDAYFLMNEAVKQNPFPIEIPKRDSYLSR